VTKGNRAVVKGGPVRKTKLYEYFKGRTGDLLWGEETCKAIPSNAIKGQGYLGNDNRNTKFGYGCRTGAPSPATGETGICV